jgi:hypothetical protein
MVPKAALATMMQTPRPPCSAPHRPAPRDRRGFRRPRASRGPLASRPEPSRAPAAREGAVTPGAGRARGPVACRVLAGGGSSGWAGSLRVGGPSPAARGVAPRGLEPRPFGPVPVRPPAPRPSQPGSRPRWPAPRGPAPRGPAPRGPASCGPDPGGAPVAGGRPAVPPRAPGAPGGGTGTGPRGPAPGSPPYGTPGRVSRHRGSLIGASDVSRCGLVTGT